MLSRLSISVKLLFLSVLPLLLLTVLLLHKGQELYETKKNSSQTINIVKLAIKLHNIAHQHALERGLTAGFLASNGSIGKEKLLMQRNKTDLSVTELTAFLNANQYNLKNVNANISRLVDLLKKTKIIRSNTDRLSNDRNFFSYYSSVNKNTIDIIDILATRVKDITIRSELDNLVTMQWLEERSGQSRGALNAVYAKGSATTADYANIHGYIKDFDNKLELLINNRLFHTKPALKKLIKLPLFTQINAIQTDFISQSKQLYNIQGPTSQQWFPFAKQRVVMIKAIIDKQASYILNQSQQIVTQSQYYLIVGCLMIIAIIFALIGLTYYIAHDISHRIRNINTLLTRSISDNDLSIKIDVKGSDEVSHIAEGINSYMSWLKNVINDINDISLEHEHLANHDSLTKLPNRSLFFNRLEHLTDQLHRHDRQHAILYIDLDFFKQINDEHGHAIGDKVLQTFSHRLLSSIRINDTGARIGGDEFAVILEEITPDQAQLVTQELLEEMKKPLLIDDITLNIGISVGMTFFPNEESNDPKVLLHQADQALYKAKNSGRQHYRCYEVSPKSHEEKTV
jgi:diguanylate cyclase (GGDEF)-like protein